MVDLYKQAIRRTCQFIRKQLPADYQRKASQQVCQHISSLSSYRYAKSIALYQAANGEINLNTLWRSAPLQGKYCYFPALNDDKTLSFLPATPKSDFRQNRFGIEEPLIEREHAIPIAQLDLMFIPLVAFDKRGTRLGMGAGYYDRTLNQSKTLPLLIGVAYEFQHQSFIEARPWDIPLQIIITERRIYQCQP